MEGYFDD
ncbi:Protein of unknown function [Bacillus mycoides]|nr:Protein of unknown function [Bacillus mycoides]